MDEQGTTHDANNQSQTPLDAAKQAAYERAYYQAASEVPWAADQVKEHLEQNGVAGGPSAASGSNGSAGPGPAASAASDAAQSSFVDYVNSEAFQQATQAAQPQAQQPFVGNAYQQPWASSGGAGGQGAYGQATQGQGTYGQPYGQASGYQGSARYQQAYNRGYAQATRAQQQTYAPYVATKDHVAAGLLAIFLGSFGIHKFYLGYNTAGFIMLGVTILGSIFTLGLAAAVMGVISLVEGIIYLTKSQGAFDAEYVYAHKEWF